MRGFPGNPDVIKGHCTRPRAQILTIFDQTFVDYPQFMTIFAVCAAFEYESANKNTDGL